MIILSGRHYSTNKATASAPAKSLFGDTYKTRLAKGYNSSSWLSADSVQTGSTATHNRPHPKLVSAEGSSLQCLYCKHHKTVLWKPFIRKEQRTSVTKAKHEAARVTHPIAVVCTSTLPTRFPSRQTSNRCSSKPGSHNQIYIHYADFLRKAWGLFFSPPQKKRRRMAVVGKEEDAEGDGL